MFLVIRRKRLLFSLFFAVSICAFFLFHRLSIPSAGELLSEKEITQLLQHICHRRNQAILRNNLSALASLFDRRHRYGVWAYEHHVRKTKYLHAWHQKQGAILSNIKSIIKIRRMEPGSERIRLTFLASTEYHYVYKDEPKKVNLMRIGTYHALDLTKNGEHWLISREWYTDPFSDVLAPNKQYSPHETAFILSQKSPSFTGLNPLRLQAVVYADEYSGAASDDERGFKYNPKYKNFNYCGGDCANFVSQVLHEGGGFPKTAAWNYAKGEASRAWSNAQAFNSYMASSGRASRIAYGTYHEVLPYSYRLLPGDYIAYEKHGKVTHVSLVTGVDSKGYTLTNSHNADRHRVPWDLGYGGKRVRFYLMRVHY